MDQLPQGWFARLRSQGVELWSKLSTPVRLMLAGLGLAMIVAAVLAVRSGQPQQVPLPGQPFDPKDLETIVARLNDLKVPYTQTADGTTIMVPQDRLLDARLALAQAGVNSGPAGYELFDQTNLAATDFDRQVTLLRAMEGELSRAIGAMSPIQTAVVKLAIPERTVFVRDTSPVKAAVMIQPRAGRKLSAPEVEGIIRFVAGAVAELDPENVMVVDQTGQVLAAGLKEGELAGGLAGQAADARVQQQLDFQRSLEEKLQAMLEGPLGPGNVSVMVSAKLNLQASRTESTTYANPGPGNEPIKLSSQTRTVFAEGTGTAPEPPAGVDANVVAPPVYAAADSGGNSLYEARESTENYLVNEVRQVVEQPPGEVESITVGVFVNDTVIPAGDAGRLAQIQQVVASAVGTPLAMVTVATMPFNNDLVKALTAEPAAPAGRLPWQTLAAAALGALALLFLLMYALRRRPALQPALAGAGVAGAPMDLAAAGLAVPEQAVRRLAPDDGLDLLGEEIAAQMGVDPARKKLRGEVEKLAKQSPDMVASLVRAWISEDRK